MKINIGETGHVKPGTTLEDAFTEFEGKMKTDTMVKVIEKKTGKTGIVVILNGKVIKASEYNGIILEEGDDLRLHHPYFGG